MNFYRLSAIAGALVVFAGLAANAGRPQTISCSNPTANFEHNDCDGSVTLYCQGNAPWLVYGLNKCSWWKTQYEVFPTGPYVKLQYNRRYSGQLTNTPNGTAGTVLTVDTSFSAPPPQAPPPQQPSQSEVYTFVGQGKKDLYNTSCGAGTVEVKKSPVSGNPIADFQAVGGACSFVDISVNSRFVRTVNLTYDNHNNNSVGIVPLAGLFNGNADVVLKLRSQDFHNYVMIHAKDHF